MKRLVGVIATTVRDYDTVVAGVTQSLSATKNNDTSMKWIT